MTVLPVPPRFEIDGKINGNTLQKLAFPRETRNVTFSPFEKNRTTGQIATDAEGRRTFICQNRTNAAIDCDDILHVPGGVDIGSIVAAASGPDTRWLKPKAIDPSAEPVEYLERRCRDIVSSWTGKFELREEVLNADGTVAPGLRRPQVGAVHAALAHWSVTHSAATIVMPTGTGKTETMLALLVCGHIERLMVVVPTSALREQIARKFLELGVLKSCGCLHSGAELPVVAVLHHRPGSPAEVNDIFRRANVVISTMQIAGQCTPEVQARMAELSSHLFIDEAHHIAARTWYEFKQAFESRSVLQFTATPFRTDGRRVDGRFIYSYPLAKAQVEGYFQKINFVPITEYDSEEADLHIALKAKECLERDLAAGRDHILMVRVDSISRAVTVHQIYAQKLRDVAPVLLHSQMAVSERREALRKLHARDSRAIVCVDMLGEGFDLPELKIAALHDRHKSLAITLQFTGRFTRAKPLIGEATVIANIADDAISDAIRTLYAEDADWNFLIRVLAEGATERARHRAQVIEGFAQAMPDIPIQTLFPRMSAVIYKTTCANWTPLNIEDVIPGAQLHAGPVINPEYSLAIFVTRDEEAVRWGSVKQIQNLDWNLYVLHWNADLNLLFINSSKPKDFHEPIAEAVGGSKERLQGEIVFRALHGISRLALTNLGLSHAFGKNIRYTMFMGADIGEGLSEASRLNRRKSNLFGLGYEDDQKTSVGCSFKGRFWSHRIAYDLSEWVAWCRHVGRKLLDETVSTEGVFRNLVTARRITERPECGVVMVTWPEGFQEQSEEAVVIEIGAATAAFFDCDIGPENHDAMGPLRFSVSTGDLHAIFEVELTEQNAVFRHVDGGAAFATVRGKRKSLAEWFQSDPPIIHFANGDFLVFNELFKVPRGEQRITYDRAQIVDWDWTGIDIRTESQGDDKDPTSVQRHVIDKVLNGKFGDFDVVFDDDGRGEVADIVAMRKVDRKLVIYLFHCKYSAADEPGARLGDLYEVCGQAQKCIRWREDPRKFLKHLINRELARERQGRASRLEHGKKGDLQSLMNSAREMTFDFKVHIVQPGLSKSAMSSEHLDLLGATAEFLMQTYSMPLEVIASA